MSEKVVITEKQESQLKKLLSVCDNKKVRAVQLKTERGDFNDCYDSLNVLSGDDFIKALYIGYEVEPEFKKGDWVAWRGYEKKTGMVLNVMDFNCETDIKEDGKNQVYDKNDIRHATESEIAAEKEWRLDKKFREVLKELDEYDIKYFRKKFNEIAFPFDQHVKNRLDVSE